MTNPQNRSVACSFGKAFRFAGYLCVTALSISVSAHLQATITWSGGTNTVPADTTLHDTVITISGGTNSVQGAGAAAMSGVLQLDSSGGTGGLEITGATLTLNSDPTKPGILSLMDRLTSKSSPTTSIIANGGVAATPGTIDCSTGTRTFTVEAGALPANAPDLSITARIRNSAIRKEGAGILALSGQNTYTGGTTLVDGRIYINSSAAIGNGPFTVSGNGPGIGIDNTSGAPITLTNNNQFNLTGGDLNFVGSNNLNLGTGFFVLFGAPTRTLNVQNAAATLTIGGVIADNGSGVALTKEGPGTLVLEGSNIYAGGTTVNAGILDVATNAETGAGLVTVNPAGTLIADGTIDGAVVVNGAMAGLGTIEGSLTVNSGGLVDVDGGTLTVNGAVQVANGGLFIFSHDAQVNATSFTNNGVLDIMTQGTFTPPANFTNNGTIVDVSAVKTKSTAKAGTTVTLTIDSFTGHTYQLQKSTTTPAGTAFTTNIGSSQNGNTGNVLSFTDASASGTKAFYRIVVDL